jgi:hypothetical protein
MQKCQELKSRALKNNLTQFSKSSKMKLLAVPSTKYFDLLLQTMHFLVVQI